MHPTPLLFRLPQFERLLPKVNILTLVFQSEFTICLSPTSIRLLSVSLMSTWTLTPTTTWEVLLILSHTLLNFRGVRSKHPWTGMGPEV